MGTEKLRGLAETYALFGRLPESAEQQLGVELAIISRDILVEQQRLVPKDTRALEAGLSIAVDVERLRARIGLIGVKRGRHDLFYGRIVNFGRAARTVLVTRRGFLGRRKGYDTGKFYKLKVKAMAARNFIDVLGAEDLAIGQLAEFWSRALARTGDPA